MGFNKHSRNVTCNLLLSLKQEAKSLIKAPGSLYQSRQAGGCWLRGEAGQAGCRGMQSWLHFATWPLSWDCRDPGQGMEMGARPAENGDYCIDTV